MFLLELRDRNAVRWLVQNQGAEQHGFPAGDELDRSSALRAPELSLAEGLRLARGGVPVSWKGLHFRARPDQAALHARLLVPDLEGLEVQACQFPWRTVSLLGILAIQSLVVEGRLEPRSLQLWRDYWNEQPDAYR